MTKTKGMFYIDGEPELVSFVRKRILDAFSDLEFIDEGHQYFLNGQAIEQSVSSVGERFVRFPFDKERAAERYAAKHGETAQYWKDQWSKNSFRATTLGTKTHEFGESLGYLRVGHPEFIQDSVKAQYMEELKYLAPIHPKEEAVEKFFADMPKSMHLVLNEAMVYSGKNSIAEKNLKEVICGTFDMLYYDENPDSEGFVVLDFKTNKSLESEYNREHHRMLMEPFGGMVEEDLSLYTIQLSLYSLMLEDIGIPIKDRKIVWLADTGEYQLISVPDVSAQLRAVL